jgi:hypothetical protein
LTTFTMPRLLVLRKVRYKGATEQPTKASTGVGQSSTPFGCLF